jgi:outer membrane lipoprotein-sorting protein
VAQTGRVRLSTRWAVPSVLAATLLTGSLVLPRLASADPELPPTTAAELLADVAGARAQGFSGTVVQTTDLGLPQLPNHGPEASEIGSLLAGSTTLRIWYDGAERNRVAVLGTLAESDVVHDGRNVYLWRSDSNTALHATLPAHERKAAERAPLPVTPAPSPQEAAQRALAALEPSTVVRLDGTATVAGRDAHELVLEPRDAESLVGSVRIAVDAATSFPLRVQVVPRGAQTAAFETGFTEISFTAPGDEVFRFSPPPGATVEEVDPSAVHRGSHGVAPGETASPDGRPAVVGEGWTSVLVLRDVDPSAQPDGGGDPLVGTLLDALRPVQGAYGTGRLFTSSLLSVLWLDDGRLLAGAVGPDVLERAALDPAATPAPAAP